MKPTIEEMVEHLDTLSMFSHAEGDGVDCPKCLAIRALLLAVEEGCDKSSTLMGKCKDFDTKGEEGK